jgi:hypothetical protein
MVYHQGYAVIEEWEMRTWWNRERITKSVYQDIKQIWDEIAGDAEKLSITSQYSRTILIQPTYFVPIEKWCK